MKSLSYHFASVIFLSSLCILACEDTSQSPTRDITIEIDDSDPNRDSTDAMVDSEISQPDQMIAPPHLTEPRAKVFIDDPIHSEGELTEVTLKQTSDPSGFLTSDAVQVFNCLNEEGGVTGEINMGISIEVSLCREAQTVTPDADGHYLSYEPPEDYTDPNDPFAEVMMYYHVNQIAEYFLNTHDYQRYEEPLPALVNVQLKTNPPLPFDGLRPGPDGFIPLDNALFFPKESWQLFAQQFGLPPRDTDLIVFFQGAADFAYDASVIYHEYIHAVIGVERLQGQVVDRYGVDASPRGMNEGLADFFAATELDLPDVGLYGIGTVNGGEGRDLSQPYRCPTDTHWEVHVHGRVIGSAMWEARVRLGREVADRVMFDALELFTPNTTHQEASELLLAEAEEEGEDVAATLREVLLAFGMLDCVRSRPWENYRASDSRDRVPYAVPGKFSIGIPSLRAIGVPAYKQFNIAPPEEEGRAGASVSWKLAAQQTGFGGPAEVNEISLAMKIGEPVELELGPANYLFDFWETPDLEEGNEQRLFIPTACFKDQEDNLQTLHTLFVNAGGGELLLTEMSVEWLATEPEGISVATCTTEEPIAGEMAGEIAGEMAGETAGEMAGETAGEMAGETAGEMP